MTWSYNPALSSNLDLVRFRVGDIDSTEQQFSNEELNAIIAAEANLALATARVCFALEAKFARKPSQSVVGSSVTVDSRIKTYHTLGLYWQERGGGAGADIISVAPWAGGISQADKDVREEDTDRVAPSFTRNLFATDERSEDLTNG